MVGQGQSERVFYFVDHWPEREQQSMKRVSQSINEDIMGQIILSISERLPSFSGKIVFPRITVRCLIYGLQMQCLGGSKLFLYVVYTWQHRHVRATLT